MPITEHSACLVRQLTADDDTAGPHLVHGLACGPWIQLRQQLPHRWHGFWVEVYSFAGCNGHAHLHGSGNCFVSDKILLSSATWSQNSSCLPLYC